MNQRKIIDIALWVLLGIGFLGALNVSYANFTGKACPQIGIVPICYVVLIAYAAMIIAIVVPNNRCKHYFFCAGWGTAFVIALIGSASEILGGGGICPTTGGGGVRGASNGSIPMCYVSLALTIAILILFLMGPYKRACDIHNAKG